MIQNNPDCMLVLQFARQPNDGMMDRDSSSYCTASREREVNQQALGRFEIFRGLIVLVLFLFMSDVISS